MKSPSAPNTVAIYRNPILEMAPNSLGLVEVEAQPKPPPALIGVYPGLSA